MIITQSSRGSKKIKKTDIIDNKITTSRKQKTSRKKKQF